MNTDNQITDNPKIISLPINNVRIDGNTQYRILIDQPTVYNYRDAIIQEAQLPLIDVVYDGTDYWLTDGFHRYHALKLLGIREIQVNCKNGCLRDAQIEALKANCQHGKQLTNEDKRNKVEMALKIEGFDKKSDREIATLCGVSFTFVSAIRRPEIKEKQIKNKKKSMQKVAETISQERSPTTPTEPNPYAGMAPDEDEIRASELGIEAYMEEIEAVIQADDKLAEASEVIKKQAHRIAQLELRMHGIMNEKNTCIKMIKQLQKENTRLKTINQTASQNSVPSTLEEFRGH